MAVVFHSRALSGSISSADGLRLYLDRPYHSRSALSPLPSEVRKAAAALRASKRPVLIAGNGIRLARADAALRTFAERHGIPVATTAAGKGVFAETHPLALGVIGTFGNPTANAAVGDADLILAVATKLGATRYGQREPGSYRRAPADDHPDRRGAAERGVGLPGRHPDRRRCRGRAGRPGRGGRQYGR